MISSRITSRSGYLTRLAKANICSNNLPIQHDSENSEFSVHLHANKAFVSYTYDSGNHKISIDHTEVPQIFQGKGVGKRLVEAAIQHALREKMKITIQCEFAQKYYKDNESRFKTKQEN